jgi:hypothetical protein
MGGSVVDGKITVKCSFCKGPARIKPSRLKYDKYHYCSKECVVARNAASKADNRITVKCGGCDKDITVLKSHLKTYKTPCCSKVCADRAMAKNRVTVKCANCGKEHDRSPAFVKGRVNLFCCKPCAQEHRFTTRSKLKDCKKCGAKLMIGEGWAGVKKKNKTYICDKCKTEDPQLSNDDCASLDSSSVEKCFCGEPIGGQRAARGAIYCSSSCSAKYRKKTHVEAKDDITRKMRSHLNYAFKTRKGGIRWRGITGYSVGELRKHLEKQFLPGMGWHNRDKWHIDHIIPVRAFNYQSVDDADFKRCWGIKNLQPMWARDNTKKSGTLDRPFQPMLAGI